MRAHPLATLVATSGDHIDANHIPLLLSEQAGTLGCLSGHIARANPIWRDCREGAEVLAIFHGPNAYISPGWYPSKAETGKVVPTWNYVAVHAYGSLRFVEDAGYIRACLETLTDLHETGLPEPWRVSDAPADFIAKLIESVVGIEITIKRLSGKWKISQNQPQPYQQGVIQGLKSCKNMHSQEMADFMQQAINDA